MSENHTSNEHIETRISKLENKVSEMAVDLGSFRTTIEYFDKTINKLDLALDKLKESQTFSISQWLKENFVTLLMFGALVLYQLGILKP